MHYEKYSITQHSVPFTYHFCLLGGKSEKKNKNVEMILDKHCSQCKLLGITTICQNNKVPKNFTFFEIFTHAHVLKIRGDRFNSINVVKL